MTAPATPSWDLLQAVATRMAIIRTANGYRTELGADVRTEALPYDNVTALILSLYVTSMPLLDEGSTPRQQNGSVEFAFEAFCPGARAASQELAHQAIADILDAFPRSQRATPIGVGNSGLVITGRSILTRPNGAALIVAQVTARAGLVERPIPRDL